MIEVTDLKNQIEELTNMKEEEKLSEAILRVLLSDQSDEFIKEYMKLIEYDTTKDYIMDVYSSFFADRENLSQDYTPQSLGKLLAVMANEQDENITTVLDLCCGSGSLSLEFFKQNPNCFFYMIELDSGVIPFLLLNLSIRGINADVINGDGLSFEFFNIYKVRKQEKYSSIEKLNNEEVKNYKMGICDCAISNPPFNVHYKDKKDYSKYCGYKQTSYADALFAINCLENVKEDGKVYYITFPGTCYHNDSTANFRKYVIENNVLVGIVRMPEKFFMNTNISVDLWVMDKKKTFNEVLKVDEFSFINNTKQNYEKDFFIRYKRGSFGGKCHENRVYEKKYNGLNDDNIRIIIDSLFSGSSHLRDYVYKANKSDFDKSFNFSEFLDEKNFEESKNEKIDYTNMTQKQFDKIYEYIDSVFHNKPFNDELIKAYKQGEYKDIYNAYVDVANHVKMEKIMKAGKRIEKEEV